MLNPEDPTVRTAVFGRQVQDFLDGDIGQYLIQCAAQQSEQYTRKLKDVDPFKPESIVACQLKIQVADSFINWLGDAVRAGLQATEVISHE